MKKFILLLMILLSTLLSYGQVLSTRSNGQNTLADNRLIVPWNFVPPMFADTTAANLKIGLDSCGAIINTRSPRRTWYRDCTSGKIWKQYAFMSDIVVITPTFQEVLTAGSVLTTNNTIENGAYSFRINGISSVPRLIINSSHSSIYSPDGSKQFNVFDDSVRITGHQQVTDTTYFKPTVTGSPPGSSTGGVIAKLTYWPMDGNGIYSGNGSLNSNRTINGLNHNLTISNLNTMSISASLLDIIGDIKAGTGGGYSNPLISTDFSTGLVSIGDIMADQNGTYLRVDDGLLTTQFSNNVQFISYGAGALITDVSGNITAGMITDASISTRKYSNNIVTGTNANITAAAGTSYHLPAATLSTNRTIDVSGLNVAGDYLEISNQEAGFTWSFTGASVYLADETTVTILLAQTNYIIRFINGKLRIIN